MKLDMNTIQSLNKDPKSLDLHSMSLANLKNAKVNVGAMHDMIADRARTKRVGNFDEAFRKLNALKKNGVLDMYNKRFGPNKELRESGVPIAPMVQVPFTVTKKRHWSDSKAQEEPIEITENAVQKIELLIK